MVAFILIWSKSAKLTDMLKRNKDTILGNGGSAIFLWDVEELAFLRKELIWKSRLKRKNTIASNY